MKTFNSFDAMAAGYTVGGLTQSEMSAFTPHVMTENAVFKMNGNEVQPEDFSGTVRETMEAINDLEARYKEFIRRRDKFEHYVWGEITKLTSGLQKRLQRSHEIRYQREEQDKTIYDDKSNALSGEKMTVSSDVFGITEKQLF